MEQNIQSIKYNNEKEEFFNIYQKYKIDAIDLYSLDQETLEKMCEIIQEEINIKKKILENKKNKIRKMITNFNQ